MAFRIESGCSWHPKNEMKGLNKLIKWARDQSEKWVKDYVDGAMMGTNAREKKIIRGIGESFYSGVISDEARKRWAVSRHTANDYADIVSRAIQKECSQKLEIIARSYGLRIVDDYGYYHS